MPSQIDPTLPTSAAPRVSHIRQNFYAAMTEINALLSSDAALTQTLANVALTDQQLSATLQQHQTSIAALQAAAPPSGGGGGAPSDKWQPDAILRWFETTTLLTANVWMPFPWDWVQTQPTTQPTGPDWMQNFSEQPQATATWGNIDYAYTIQPTTANVIAATRIGSTLDGWIYKEPSTHPIGNPYTTTRRHQRRTDGSDDFTIQIKVDVDCELIAGPDSLWPDLAYCLTSQIRTVNRTLLA